MFAQICGLLQRSITYISIAIQRPILVHTHPDNNNGEYQKTLALIVIASAGVIDRLGVLAVEIGRTGDCSVHHSWRSSI